MRYFITGLLGLSLFACGGNPEKQKTEETAELQVEKISTESQEEEVLTGEQPRKAIEAAPYQNWFGPGYESYKVDKDLLPEISEQLKGKTITIFMGTWCGDSQREVPHFFRILDEAGFPEDHVRLITMDRNKTTPENLEEGLNIINVPTFIFYENGEEMNRMVEFPLESLESDMLKILKGEPYTNPYGY
ncbi:thioredoxin family protein [Robertkochia aurantiaca]|uniref:thioredoxin family protein n=1 Tax=Robertkochia aurantiaca TaxID=2873700 RepID=UPI001CCB8725|nr:thioredoxin family protein [Robertkochia sp. 3YJGBD-33]